MQSTVEVLTDVGRPWQRAYDPGVPAHLADPGIRLEEVLHRTAVRYADRAALVFYGRRTTFAELDAVVGRLAAGLRRIGVADGERVALLMPNCPQLVASFYAVWRAGAIAVPCNSRSTASELGRQVADAEASTAIVLDRLWTTVEELPRDGPLRRIVRAEVADALPFGLRIAATLAHRGRRGLRTARPDLEVIGMRELVRPRPDDAAVAMEGPDGIAVLLYTGGTTGMPKAAVLTHRNLVANAGQIGAWASSLDNGAEVMLAALPLVHGYAMTACMNASILRGWTQVLVPDPRDIERLLSEIERQRVTVFPGVPTLYAAICDHPSVRSGRRDLRSIEACLSGAATLPSGIQAEFERVTGGRLVEGYGLTEASPVTHCNPIGSGGRMGSIGLPLPDTDCRLVDVETETRPVATGERGILCVSGPQVMAGYWRRPEETEQVLRLGADGRRWLHTGDVGTMDADGYVRIVDRKKDVIVAAGGLKVYPNEIEDALSRHPKVRLSAVIGVPVGGADQRAKAYVVLREGESAQPDEILAYLRQRLAAYKVPKSVEFRPELPLAFTGKVLRRVLAEQERATAPS